MPGLNHFPVTGIMIYRESLGLKAMNVSGGIPLNLAVFWTSVSSDDPQLPEILACLNTADTEREVPPFTMLSFLRDKDVSKKKFLRLWFFSIKINSLRLKPSRNFYYIHFFNALKVVQSIMLMLDVFINISF